MADFPSMTNIELEQRTKEFALRVIKMSESLPRTIAAEVLGRQLVRSSCSVAANYRAACRAKSRPDFISKMGTVEEEADESGLWLELIVDSNLMPAKRLDKLRREAGELTAIAVSSIRTARSGRKFRNPPSAVRNPS